jgi:hypothetical protein
LQPKNPASSSNEFHGIVPRTVNTYLDRTDWENGSGPWDNEPDHVQWTDKATGLPCLIHRGGTASWCGYVAVAEGHPWFEKDYEAVEPYPDVHGGLTYHGYCMDSAPEGEGICHVPEPGQPDRVWWLGFDCAHYGDLSPRYKRYYGTQEHETYKDAAYVIRETESLARQIKDAA